MYNGLTTADKGALLDAKARGAEWVANDSDGSTYWYETEPVPSAYFVGKWTNKRGAYGRTEHAMNAEITDPVHIPTALAQIAEMESAEKSSGCDVCRGVKILSGTFHGVIRADDETQMEVDSDGDVDFDFCPVCGRNLNSPYTEGATK